MKINRELRFLLLLEKLFANLLYYVYYLEEKINRKMCRTCPHKPWDEVKCGECRSQINTYTSYRMKKHDEEEVK